jgi:hypothetical protein
MACHVFRLQMEAVASRCRLLLQIFWARPSEQQRGIPLSLGMCVLLKSPYCRGLVCCEIQGRIPDVDEFYGLAWNTDNSIRFLIWKVLLWVSEIKYKGVDWIWHTSYGPVFRFCEYSVKYMFLKVGNLTWDLRVSRHSLRCILSWMWYHVVWKKFTNILV